jgi:hypothetical protein
LAGKHGRDPSYYRVPRCAARKICEALGNSQQKFQKFGIKVIGGFCLGRGIVPGDAVRTRKRYWGLLKRPDRLI